MKRFLASISALLLLALPSLSQGDCSSLTIEKKGVRPGYDTLRLRFEGAPPNSPGWLAIGSSNQPSTLHLSPHLVLNLGISQALTSSYFGMTDDLGSIMRTTYVPVEIDLHFFVQAVILEDMQGSTPRFSFCTSNVEEVEF